MSLRRALGPALSTLRSYRGTVLLCVTAGAVGLAAALPVTSLVAPHAGHFATRLGVAAMPGESLGMNWGPYALTPTAMRQWGVHMLFDLLAGVAIGVLGGAAPPSFSRAPPTPRAPGAGNRRPGGAGGARGGGGGGGGAVGEEGGCGVGGRPLR